MPNFRFNGGFFVDLAPWPSLDSIVVKLQQNNTKLSIIRIDYKLNDWRKTSVIEPKKASTFLIKASWTIKRKSCPNVALKLMTCKIPFLSAFGSIPV